MKTLSLFEHERVYRERWRDAEAAVDISDAEIDRLIQYDEYQAGEESDQLIFESRTRWIKPTNTVGVVRLGDITVEVLPKVDRPTRGSEERERGDARANLLYMLSLAADLPLREQDLADQDVQRAPILDTLARLFGERLRAELLKGAHREYVTCQENLYKLKGKIQFPGHIRRNAVHRERFFVEYEEFQADNPLNRCLKAATRLLLRTAQFARTREALSHCMMLLDDVSDVEVFEHDFDTLQLDRRNARFEQLVSFARLVVTQRSPTASHGPQNTFSLLFNMEVLFESFVTQFIRRHVLRRERFEDLGCRLYSQRGKELRYLIYHQKLDGDRRTGALALKPDILIAANVPDEERRVIIDTKWKALGRHKKPRQGVSRSDVHQMHAYAHVYGATHNVLLYPQPDDAAVKSYDMPSWSDQGHTRFLHVRFVNVSGNLCHERKALADNLEEMLGEMLELRPRPTSESGAPSTALR